MASTPDFSHLPGRTGADENAAAAKAETAVTAPSIVIAADALGNAFVAINEAMDWVEKAKDEHAQAAANALRVSAQIALHQLSVLCKRVDLDLGPLCIGMFDLDPSSFGLGENDVTCIPAFSGLPGWTGADVNAAAIEGWEIYDCSGAGAGPFHLRRRADLEGFSSDVEVWRHVVDRANEGSALHMRALEFVSINSPAEYDAIAGTYPLISETPPAA